MPDGPLFSDQEAGSVQVPCQVSKKGSGKWTTDCVLKILCKRDPDVVEKIAKSKVDKADGVYFKNPYFDGKKWTLKHLDVDGYAIAEDKYIMMLSDQSCEEAASTFYHETWHHYQDEKMGWPHEMEDDAYYHEELWNLDRGLKGNPNLQTVDKAGKVVPDKEKIRKYVDDGYPVSPPGEKISGRKTDAKGHSWTKYEDEKTGKDKWRRSKKGDTYQGNEYYTNQKTISPSTWKCP